MSPSPSAAHLPLPVFNEKLSSTPALHVPHSTMASSPPPPPCDFAYPTPSLHRDYIHPPRHVRLCSLLRPWLPLLAYLSTTAAFLLAVAFWRSELFAALDDLSSWLKHDPYGPAVMFALIFVTTFPPLPLYSTLIVLSGYTFGALHGALIAYTAALSGALIVFLLSRHLLRSAIQRWLRAFTSVRRVVRAIERRPQLLFLVRLAPYPYNVMNCLLGASKALSVRTYMICTALSLVKVGVHTSIGASVRSFARMHQQHVHAQGEGEGDEQNQLALYWTVGGIALCVGIILYLAIVARRAVDEELDGDDLDDDEFEPCGARRGGGGGFDASDVRTDEETVSFLAATEDVDGDEEPVLERGMGMTERARTPVYVSSSAVAGPARLV